MNDLIYAYTRAMALEDGTLVDISKLAKEAGFKWHFAATAAAFACIEPNQEATANGQSLDGRLWDVFTMARFAIRKAADGQDRVTFQVIIADSGDTENLQTFELHIGPGDEGEPVFTLMLPGED